MRLICLFVGTVLRICVVKLFFYYPNNLISAKYASFALSIIVWWNLVFTVFLSNVVTLALALALSARFAEDVWYSCWRSAHCDRGEWNVSSCNWWVCTCASFLQRPCVLLRPITAFPSCFVWFPSTSQLGSSNAHVCVSSFSLTWIPELMFSFCWKPDLLSEKIWSV